jgi:hypothetical protein
MDFKRRFSKQQEYLTFFNEFLCNDQLLSKMFVHQFDLLQKIRLLGNSNSLSWG